MLVVMKRKGRMESVLLGLVLLLCRTNGLQLGDGTVGWCGELDVAFLFDGGFSACTSSFHNNSPSSFYLFLFLFSQPYREPVP